MSFERNNIQILRQRLDEPPQLMIVVSGPRQIGKTTMVRQALAGYSSTFVAADQPVDDIDPFSLSKDDLAPFKMTPGAPVTVEWLVLQWERARSKALALTGDNCFVLAIDEIQKIPRWSEVVKGLWDADRAAGVPLHIVLLGSSPWLVQKGLAESLAGRYDPLPMTHWSYSEMQDAFDFSLDEYIYFGGYPGCAGFIRDEPRWKRYVRGALIAPNIENDILQMTRVDKPALLKTLFELGCGAYSGQIISYTKLLGQLDDAGNTVTLAHYLVLLSQAGLLTGLQKYSGAKHRQRASSPKFNALNTGLMSALADYTFDEAKSDRTHWGRLVESAIGAHIINTASDNCTVHYWREGAQEVDFVLSKRNKLVAIEVKSGIRYATPKGLATFTGKFKDSTSLIVGEGSVSLAEFLSHPANKWLMR